MSNTRHVVVVRKDLQMSQGLLAAQVAHMSDAFMRKVLLVALKEGQDAMETHGVFPDFSENELDWFEEPYLSVLAVNCYEDLVEICEHAEREKLPVNKWEDLVPSPTIEGKSIKAFVGISIGPADFDAIKIVTGCLDLY